MYQVSHALLRLQDALVRCEQEACSLVVGARVATVNVVVAFVDFWGPVMAPGDAFEIELGILEVFFVDHIESLDVILGLPRDLHGCRVLLAPLVLVTSASIDTKTSTQKLRGVAVRQRRYNAVVGP